MSAGSRFSEFVTSGAFTLTLTRQQISQLALLADGESLYGTHALFRKGLADEVSRPDLGDERTEHRITAAGALVVQLCQMAGLTNGDGARLQEEIQSLHSQLLDLRQRNADLQKTSRSFQARYEASQIAVDRANVEIKNLRTELELGLRLKNGIKTFERPIVTIRDPLPDLSDCELGARIGEDA